MKLELNDIKKFYKKGPHGIEHITRVFKNSVRIAATEKCDLEVIKAAAVLHDIARELDEYDKQGRDHAEAGAEKAKEILKEYDYTIEQITNILHCIRVHRYSSKLKPETIEAAIIQDADRLDALGAIIIARVFQAAGERKQPIHDPSIPPSNEYKGGAHTTTPINHFYEKILKIKPETFNTKKGRELAKTRYEFVKKYLDQFLAEYNCEI